jgi:tryptophan synthase alpha chain
MSRIQASFLAAANRPLIIPFLTAGYPALESTAPAVLAMIRAGADMIEIGIPFSDPLADGPTIQRSSERAIANGMTLGGVLKAVRSVRADADGGEVPILLMGYCNPILHFGTDRFIAAAADAGVDGLIIPDLPPEEADPMRAPCAEAGLSMVFLMAPNTPDDRLCRIDQLSTDFSYCVSITGVTGARGAVQDRTVEFLGRVASLARKPFVVGFGVKGPEHVRALGPHAAGVVIGSALIDAIDTAIAAGADPLAALGDRVRELRGAADEVARGARAGEAADG